MSEVLADYPLDENVAALRQVFTDSPDAVYLRGSLLRGEIPYDDLDIIEVGDKPHAANIPESFRGAAVAYRHLTRAEWEAYLHECPRSWYMYYDTAALHSHDDEADKIFADEQKEFFASKEHDHLAYLRYESEVVSNQQTTDEVQDYEGLKNIPGSKRTIMRSVFMLKALHPELRTMTTPDVLSQAASQGIVPPTIPDTAKRIYETLAEEPIDANKLRPLAQECVAWMGKLLVDVDQELSDTMPQPYLALLDTAVSSRSEQELTEAQAKAAQLEEPHRKWTASYLLANNAHLPQNAAAGIASDYETGYSGRLIRDALERRNH